jgi:hypothetical protein
MASHPIWPTAGQRGESGPDLMRRDIKMMLLSRQSTRVSTQSGPHGAAALFDVSLDLVQDMRCLT